MPSILVHDRFFIEIIFLTTNFFVNFVGQSRDFVKIQHEIVESQ